MIYMMHNLNQKPKNMADGGMSLLPGQAPENVRTGVPMQQPEAPQMSSGQLSSTAATGGPAAQPVADVSRNYMTLGGSLSGATQGVGQGIGEVFGGLGKGMAQGNTFQNQYNAQLAPISQYDFGNLIQGSGANALQGYQQYLQNLAQQQGLAGQLGMQASGQGGPSAAQAMLANSTGTNVANQAALMASQRGAGANIGMTQRNAARQGAETQQQAAGQGAVLKANEQLAAQQALGQLYNQIGQQVIAQEGASTSLFGTATGASNAQNSNIIRNYEMAQGINSKTASENTAALNKSAQSGMGAIGGMMAMLSDENQKKNISSGEGDVEEFLSNINANSYNYKKGAGMGDDKHVGPMAQELEASDLGRSLVSEGPKGKMVEYGAAGPAIMASLAFLHKEIQGLKGGSSQPQQEVQHMANGGFMGMGPLADEQMYSTMLNQSPDFRDDSKISGMGPMADGQLYGASISPNPYASGQGQPQSGVGQFLQGILNQPAAPKEEGGGGMGGMLSGMTKMFGGMAHGDIVPGTAQVNGDSERNDTIPAMLSPGEIVVPRSAAQDPAKAAAFAKSVSMRHSKKGKR